MVDFLNDDVTFEGTATHEGELIANGTLTIGPGGQSFGDPTTTPATSWLAHTRVQIPNVAARAALVAWRTANAPISADNPLLVWRADGSLTGVNEITLNGTDWYAESPLSGDIELTLATSASFGWLLMQGQLLANAAVNYPALWAAAHPVLREGSALRIPDMRGRAAIGAGQGTGLSLRNLGDITGNETVTLNTTQMPSHNHNGTTDNNTVNAHVAARFDNLRFLYLAVAVDQEGNEHLATITVRLPADRKIRLFAGSGIDACRLIGGEGLRGNGGEQEGCEHSGVTLGGKHENLQRIRVRFKEHLLQNRLLKGQQTPETLLRCTIFSKFIIPMSVMRAPYN